ncbi:tetratricopeptide repeat protein [Candidatus Uabimicrobium sp. HlEnr_7]|uniref:tetratricopeptide repeat protein n=1 Tax=Candidatus Uabimicrobium helgolandensis TaxID=3095367 RepID=UPI0035591098
MLKNVCRLLEQHKLALFIGAGVSIDAPSSIPDWRRLIDEIVRALATYSSELKNIDKEIIDAQIAPEVISQILYESIGEKYLSAFDVLKNRKPNHHHIYLAKLAKSGHVSFYVTANLDTCLEDAMLAEGMDRDKDYFVYATEADFERFMDFPEYSGVRIFKIHGSLENPQSIITTFSKEGQGLSKNKVRLLRCLLLIRHFLFIGYSGNDLNTNPNYIMLEDLAAEAKGFYWNFLPNEKTHKEVERLIKLYDERSAVLQFSGVDLLQKLWEHVDGGALSIIEEKSADIGLKSKLQEWCSSMDITSGVYHGLAALLHHIAQNSKAQHFYQKAIECYREQNDTDKLCQAACELGGLLHYQGEHEQAENIYKDVLEETVNECTIEKAFIFEGLGNLALDNGSLKESKDYYLQGLDLLEKAAHFEGVAQLCMRMGNFYKTQGEWDVARQYYNRNLLLAKEIWSYKQLTNVYVSLGDLELHQGKWKHSEEYYLKGIAIAEATGYKAGCADLYNSLGILKRKEGQLDVARSWLKNSLEIRKELASPTGIVSSNTSLGQLCDQCGEWKKAEEYFSTALEIAEKHEITVGVSLCYRFLASVMQKRGEYDKALEKLALSEEIERKFNRLPSIASVLSQKAIVLEKTSFFDEARKLYDECIGIFQKMNNRPALATLYNNLAVLSAKERKIDLALELYQKSQDINEEIGDKIALSSCLINIAIMLQVKGDWEKAEELLYKSLEYCKGINIVNEANVYLNLAVLKQKRQELQIAEDFLQKSLGIFKELNNSPMLSSSYRKMATLQQQKKEWRQAEDFLQKALNISQSKNLQMEEAENYRLLGVVYSEQNKLSEALSQFNASLQIYQEANNLGQIAQSFRLIGNIHRRKEDWGIAKEFYIEASKIQEQINDIFSLAHTHVQIGHLYREQGLVEESEKSFNIAKEMYVKNENKRKAMDCFAHIGNLMVKCKKFTAALENYRQSLKIAKELGDELEIANAQFNLSFIVRKSGNKDEAIKLLEKCLKVYEKRQKLANLRKAEKMLAMWKK